MNLKELIQNNDINLNIRDFRYLYKKVCDRIDDYDIVFISRLDSTFYIHDIERFKKEFDKETIYVNQKSIPTKKEILYKTIVILVLLK